MTQLPKTEHIILDLKDEWLTIWFNRPESRNALSVEMVDEIKQALNAVRDNRDVRGITFRGKGGVFCAGADLKGIKSLFEDDVQKEDIVNLSKETGQFFNLVNTMPQVTIMVIESAAMAGGFGLACTGDVIIVHADAQFALSETMLGLTPAQISPLIINRLGFALGKRLMLTGARFKGEEAAKMGLADFVGKDESELAELEEKIKSQVLRCAPGAVGLIKELIHTIPDLPKDKIIEVAAENFADSVLGEEGYEGINSFIEKRKPNWSE